MSAVRNGASWIVSFVPLLSLGLLTWPVFTVLAVRARSWPLAGAALAYLGLLVLEIWAIESDPVRDTVFDVCLFGLMVGGTAHAIAVRRRWFRTAPVAVDLDVVSAEYAVVAAGTITVDTTQTVESAPAQRVLDEIDQLVEESMRDGEPRIGYDYDDPTYPDCPNPHCEESWHGLAITERMELMRDYGEVDVDYDYHADDSLVLCPGSAFAGEWPTPPRIREPEHPVVQVDPAPEPDPMAEAAARADRLWTALARPALALVVTSWLLALVSMFLAPTQWRWLTVLVGAVAPVCVGWLYGRRAELFPAGYVRVHVLARPAVVFAVGLVVCAGWLPFRWARNPPLEAADGYFALIVACALACVGHAVVQIGRVLPVGAAETDPKAHGENLVVLGFGWMMFGLPSTLLFGWVTSYWAYQPSAVWAAVAINALLVAALFVEAGTIKIITKARDDGDLPMIVFFTIGAGALLVWSSLRIAATVFQS
ncbi:hypothetical protein [Nocardia sp. NPDC050718]|uniref:hypothetical protein n=1 Tax=Nocardia sp. NPDC050718 TaxID=3155788 RepID=UPI0033EB6AE6